YYMYYTTPSEIRSSGRLTSSVNNTYNMRMHIGIARSKTPVGPFYTCSDVETVNGIEQKVPYIDFKYAYDLDFDTGVIDVSPFLDDNGDLYLYFKPESFENKGSRAAIYGMKMIDWFTPDYESVKLLAAGGYTEVKSDKRGKEAFLNTFTSEEISGWTLYDGGSDLLEAPFMYKHNGKYYLTYAFHGYQNPSYSVLQSIGDSPLGDFVAPQTSTGNPVLDGTQTMYMKGTAHHSLVAVGEELYIIYHRHATTESIGAGRYLAADKVTFTKVNGQTVMTANGPSIGLNFIGEEITGCKNLAKRAKVTSTGGSGTEYLTDGLLPMYSYVDDKVFSTEEDVTIKFEFAQPVNVETIMIHNSRDSDTAFSKIADIRFELAEQPSFLSDGKTFKYAAIKDLAFPAEYWKESDEKYIACCAPAVANFDSIKVKSVSITIKASDKLILEDKYGEGKKIINISEIVILGR
ncbi:MAG: family 43 glycosylhydrolase, partial [Candidatus Scatosoma sp.]